MAEVITLHSPWFEYVRDGSKRFEGRRFKEGRFYKGQMLTVVASLPASPLDTVVPSLPASPLDTVVPSLPASPLDTVKHISNYENEPYRVVVIDILHFPTFKDALLTLPLEEVLPGVESVDEGYYVYQKYVSLETQKRDGVVMLALSRC